jgi:hypothetical protein
MQLPDWFVFFLFMGWAIGSIVSAKARFRRWRKFQREPWLLTDCLERLFMGIAFCMGAMILGPHPAYDYEWLRPVSRYFWLFAFVPFAVGIFLDWHSIAEIERERSKAGWTH